MCTVPCRFKYNYSISPWPDCLVGTAKFLDETGSDLSEGELLPEKPKGTVVRVTDKDRAVLELKGARDQVKRSKRR